MAERPGVVVLSAVLPHPRMDNAGGNYVYHVVTSLAAEAEVTVLVPNDPTNRAAREQPGVVPGRLLDTSARAVPVRAISWLLFHLRRLVGRVNASPPPLVFGWALLTDRAARAELRRARVVDLQWSEFIGLAPLVRRLAPQARLVGTFHDVLSQRYQRYAEAGERSLPRWAWRSSARFMRAAERRALRRLDLAITLSEKDRALLPGGRARTAVITPPIPAPESEQPRSARPTVLFVGNLGRDDNIDAVEWLVAEIWPLVRERFPDAELHLVGARAPERVRAVAEAAAGVVLDGFVDDLGAAYARAWAVVVPLRLGAGIKFKTIEALLGGVPLVTTPVGLEGIDAADLVEAVSTVPRELADALTRVLADPAAARDRARAAQARAGQQFGPGAFESSLQAAYAPELR
ncbi:glycosyltransferase [Granulicoccus phenolivorans]|uniref:glycosyltransferase n=1 Tax=Granulicoccus phenolivorans TaxID=266854 RepID=UPI00047A699C|nr:glycosyltransferase [Granulicoccus phenolivorans]